MPFAGINGINLYYEIQGHGDPLLLLHHGFGCVGMWDKVVPQLVEQGYKTICYDRRGYGQSEPGVGFDDFYVGDQFRPDSVQELETLRDWLGFDSFHMLGQCEGGVVAVDYAARYPHRVRRIVTSSTMCFSSVVMPEFNAAKFTKSFDELDPNLQKKLIGWHGDRAKVFFNQFRQCGGAYGTSYFDLRDTLSKVNCPTLVLYPDRSVLFEVEQGVAFYRSLPQGALAVMPNCGHNTYDEQPEEYVSHVVNFLAQHRSGLPARGAANKLGPTTCAG
jgi:pimeloyl-ACP methyl ester carboxylesterase